MLRTTCLLLLGLPLAAAADTPKNVDKAWYTPVELLGKLAEGDNLRWALPETLAGRALVGGDKATTDATLDAACKQWRLAWERSNGIVVVHRPNDDRLKKLAAALAGGDAAAAWELGWLRDARALPLLADALAGKDVAVALAAAQGSEVLDTMVPLGRDERVDALPPGRVSLAAAYPPKGDLLPLLDSPYPPVRAAALRLLLGQGGKVAEAAKAKTAADASVPVQRVRQQLLAEPVPVKLSALDSKLEKLLPAPADPAELKAACAKLAGELEGLAKQSAWEQMRWRVRVMAEWSRQGHQPATDTLVDLCGTKIQYGWFPGYVQMHLAQTGSPEVLATLQEGFAKGDRATLSRGLEQGLYGNRLLAFTRPHLTEQTLCYVTARKAGREANDDLLALAGRGDYAATDALGIVGGPEAVKTLTGLLNKDVPGSATLTFRAAKALGRIGSADALAALLEAAQSKDRFRRHAAALFLGQIGGPKATARLRELLDQDSDRLIRAAAADGLEQCGATDGAAAVAAFRKTDAALPERAYQPRNPRFGADFPVNEWVNLKVKIHAFAEFGEMGWNYDAANRLFFRYGGCSGYTNELTVFDLGTEQFEQRRPNEELAGWGDRRPSRGCSGGRAWDPLRKVAWLGPVIGGSEADLAIAEYYNKGGTFGLGTYDLATDRFRPQARGIYATRYVLDWKTGLLMPIKFTHPNHKTKDFWALDTRAADPYAAAAWLDKKTDGDYPRDQHYTNAAMDQESGLMVLYVAPSKDSPAETWTYDPAANAWKNMQPKVQPPGVSGGGLVYDPFAKKLLMQSGTKETQYGGADSITWTYDVRTNTWTDLKPKSGPGNPWVGAMDFDPEHNVFVLFHYRDKQVWAYRHQAVPVGTKVK